MKTSICRKLWIFVLIVALFASANAVFAEEETQLLTDHVELFSEGGFPENLPIHSTFATENFETYMIEQLNRGVAEIDISAYRLSLDEFSALYWAMLNKYPDLFFVGGDYRYYTPNPYMTRILPEYVYSGTKLQQMKAIYNEGISAVVSHARQASTPVGMLLRANDYFCVNFEYDTNENKNDLIYSPELLFQQKKGVCQAYMLAYRAVLNELGITNITVTSVEINHTWNMVYLDGDWYHIDVTWNDPLSDRPLRAMHTNFLLSDEGITATGHVGWDDSWEAVMTADNAQYDDYFWRTVNQVFPMNGDSLYYVRPSNTSAVWSEPWHVYEYDLSTGSKTVLHSYTYTSSRHYRNYYSMWVTNGDIYYAIEGSLYAVPLSGGEAKRVYSTGSSDLWIWNPYMSDSGLQFYVASAPSESGSVYTYSPQEGSGNWPLLYREIIDIGVSDTVWMQTILPVPEGNYTLTWSSRNPSVADVDGTGTVTGIAPGVTDIMVAFKGKTTACKVIVMPNELLKIPEGANIIDAQAFENVGAQMIVLPEGVLDIGEKAFANNAQLCLINLPDSIQTIAENAFEGTEAVTILCRAGSVAESFAQTNGVAYVIIP